jgi:hypothetical protein
MAIVLAVAGCGGDSGSERDAGAAASSTTLPATTVAAGTPSTTAATVRPGSGATTTTARPGPAATTGPTTPPTTRPRGSPCATSQLRVEPVRARQAGSTQIETFRITNTSPLSCVMTGFPTTLPFRSSGASVQANVIPIPAGEGPVGSPARRVTVDPGKTAEFYLQWSPASPPDDCQDTDGILFDAPDEDGTSVRIPFAIRFCGRILRHSVILPTGTG